MWSWHQTPIKKILLIDEDEQFARAMAYSLERKFGAEVYWTDDPNSAYAYEVDLVVADWDIDPSAASAPHAKPPLVVLTAFDGAGPERERLLKHQFSFLGVVSKEQTLDGMLENIETIFANYSVHPSA